jgi:hypothetical protein
MVMVAEAGDAQSSIKIKPPSKARGRRFLCIKRGFIADFGPLLKIEPVPFG